MTLSCGACNKAYTGTSAELRAVIWPHTETHAAGDFPLDEEGCHIQWQSEPIILSCNCGECDFCLKKAAG